MLDTEYDSGTDTQSGDRPVVLVAEGEVSSNPVPGENRSGKRTCMFSMNVPGMPGGIDMNFYTVRFRDECMKLVAGDKVRVKYVRNDRHNNLVASPEMLDEGGKLDRIMSAIENLDRAQDSISRQLSHLSMDLLEIRKGVKSLSERLDKLSHDLFEGDDDIAETGDDQ